MTSKKPFVKWVLQGIELPLHQNLIYWLPRPAALKQPLRAVQDAASQAEVLILPQIKLNSQHSSCRYFYSRQYHQLCIVVYIYICWRASLSLFFFIYFPCLIAISCIILNYQPEVQRYRFYLSPECHPYSYIQISHEWHKAPQTLALSLPFLFFPTKITICCMFGILFHHCHSNYSSQMSYLLILSYA